MNSFLLVAYLAVAIPSGLVSAANNIKFVNHCPYDVYSWTVGPVESGYTGNDHEVVTIPANSVTIEGMVNGEAIGGGISIKLRDLPKYQTAPTGIIQVEYNLEPSKNHVWYDLSAIDCDHSVGPENPSFCPLIRSGMKVHAEHANKGRCPPAWCGADGVCHHTYKEHDFWEGESDFRCDAGTDIVVEFCTEKAGPRTFNGHMEPNHSAETQPDTKPDQQTTNGVCGKRTPDGATCFGYVHGNCCSEYGWCGYSEAHCGTGCQSDFGNCFGKPPAQPSAYQSPAKPSTVQPSYAKPTSTYVKPTSSYYLPASSFYPPASTNTPKYTHADQTWPSYCKPTSSYAKPSTMKSTPSYYPPASSYTPPVKTSHSKPAWSYVTSSHSKPTPCYSVLTGYTPPAHTPSYSPPYSPPPYRTIYATHTVTETRAQVTKTVTVIMSNAYSVPSTSEVYSAPTSSLVHSAPSPSKSVYDKPSHTYVHTPQQEPHIPSTWYIKSSHSTVYDVPNTSSVYHTPTAGT